MRFRVYQRKLGRPRAPDMPDTPLTNGRGRVEVLREGVPEGIRAIGYEESSGEERESEQTSHLAKNESATTSL